MERGCQLYVRKGNFMRDKRTLNIIDEIEERMKQQKIIEDLEANRDMSYEEFLEKYLDHIEGRVDPEEVANQRPITAEESPEK